MELELKGRVALITASSKGIGKAVARGLAGEGALVSLCARDVDSLQSTAEEIRAETGGEVLATPADVSRPEGIQHVVDATLRRFGHMDILVCNAGGPPPGAFKDFPDDASWENAFQQNLMSVVRLCRAVVPTMRERGWGRIITITSITVKEPKPNLILSNVMRAGVTSLVKSLATELGPDGICVNNVLPSAVMTERFLDLMRRQAEQIGIPLDDLLDQAAQEIPLRHIATPEEFAQVVVFLASEQAGYISGVTVPIDGGAMRSMM